MEDRTELLAAIDASQMTADDKALLRDVIRVTDGGGTMREVREHVGLSVGQAALLLRTNADHLRAVEGGTERDDLLVRRMCKVYVVKGFVDEKRATP